MAVGRLWTLIRRSLFRREQDDRDLADELRFHLAQETQLRIDRGTSPKEAARGARMALGGFTLAQESVRAVWVSTTLEQLLQDVRSGARILTNAPLLTATAVTLVALVIGGNTTVFSLAHGILRKPAPGVQASDLLTLTWIRDDGFVDPGTSYANYRAIAEQSTTLRQLMAFDYARLALSHENGTHAVWGALVSTNYFRTLDVPIVLGRSFSEDESRGASSGLVAVISHSTWQHHFRAAAGAVGAAITVNGRPATIIGVAAPEFRGALLAPPVDVFVPLAAFARADGWVENWERQGVLVSIIGALAPGASLPEARTEIDTIWDRLSRADAPQTQHTSATLVTYSATAGGNSLVSTRGTAFLAVFSVVTLLTLIIVCANVANLLIGRAVVRQRELALRQSLGASRLRIVRMLLAEGFVISALAWAASCVFAWWTARALAGFVAPSASGGLPRFVTFTPDWTVLGYALLLALVATVVFTVAPAMRAWRQSLLPSLKSGEQGVVGGRSRLSSGLVILQLAFSVLLLTSAGLAYRSVFLLGTQDLGFETRNLLLVTVNTAGSAADRAADGPLIDRIRERLWAVPGVRSVSYARSPARERWSSVVVLTSAAGAPLFAEQNYVGPAYLPVHGLDRIAGRELDREEGRTIPSAMINRGLADALWPRQSPLGRRLLIGSEHLEVEVVGITPDAYFGGFRHTNPRHVLLSSQHDPTEPGELTFYMRHEGTLDAIAPLVRRALRAVDAHVPVVSLRSMDAQLESIIWPVRLLTTLLALFAGGSLLIATIGQYAVVAFDMRRRVREFGVRIALGASSGQVLTSVIRDGLRLTALGLAVGFVLSLGAGRAMGGLLYGVTPTDALTYAGVFALLLAASLLACALPARRAARIDPVRALRFE